MIQLKPFTIDDWKLIDRWTANEAELIQFSGQIFSFPIDKQQIETYLSDSKNRTVFRVDNLNNEPIGMAEISILDNDVAKLARVLIGEESMRGKGLGTVLINRLIEFGVQELNKHIFRLNVYTWNVGAVRCYKKLGFTKTSKPIKYVKVGNDTWDTIEMEKTLTPTQL